MITAENDRLRIAMIAGTLGRAGAEKQLWYMAKALRRHGVDLTLYSVTRGQHYETLFEAEGLTPQWFGQASHPMRRLATLAADLRRVRPHIVQSAHFFTNLYSGVAGRLCGAMTIGAMRNDARYELADNGRWGRILLHAPAMLIANSQAAVEGAVEVGVPSSRLRFLANVIDLEEFDARMLAPGEVGNDVHRAAVDPPGLLVIAVGRLVGAKRFDRFLEALARARDEAPELRGMLVGDGPERAMLEEKAVALGLTGFIEFKGARNDVPALLRQADMLALSSDHEGFPNVVLEAMSAGLPTVVTPAGDAGRIVQENVTGYVVPFDDVPGMADRMVRLAKSAPMRAQFGAAARQCVEQQYSYDVLANNLFRLYRDMATQQGRRDILGLLPA